MKRVLLSFLWIAFTVAALSASALAKEYTADSNGCYNVEISGKTAGVDYLIIIVAGDYTGKELPELSDDNIIYINVVTADENGVITFSDIIPMTGSVGTVIISDESVATFEGILATESGFGYIAGKLISYSGSSDSVTLSEELTSVGEGVLTGVDKVIVDRGDITFESGALSSDVKLLLSPLASAAKIYAYENGYSYAVIGDYNGDKTVDHNDLAYSLSGIAKGDTFASEDWEVLLDLDSSGEVDLRDASVLLKFLGGKIAEFHQAFTENDAVVNP